MLEYFSDMPTQHRTLLLVGGLAFFWTIEAILPLFHFKYNKWKHAGINIFFTVTTALVNLPLAFLLVKSSDWVVENGYGLLGWVEMPVWLQVVAGLMLLDLISAWFIHWLEHHVPWMWQFHIIHHADQEVDTTTANRHHPGESVFRFVFTILAVLAVGAPMWLVFLYQTLSVIMTQFNHANIQLPRWLDKPLSWVIVTPAMHHVHHHYRMPLSDTNYGNIFSVWDHIFRTYHEEENSKLRYGLDTHMEPREANNILELLKIPFKKYRGHIRYDEE